MEDYSFRIILKGEQVNINLQFLDYDQYSNESTYAVSKEGVVIAVISLDGKCRAEVLKGDIAEEDLLDICNKVDEIKRAGELK